MPTLEGIEIGFVSGANPSDEVSLLGVFGRERLSTLFTFDLLLARANPYTFDELDAMLKTPCAIAMGRGSGDMVHGILESITLLDASSTVHARYFARLVPKVWLLTQSRTSRVFQNVTVADIVAQVLASYGMGPSQFEVRTMRAAKSPVREYVVQYQETDWDFLQRWLEHEGYYYWFTHEKSGSKLIISDENSGTSSIIAPSTISYREMNNLSTGGDATIWDWSLEQRRIPASVAVFDYNYRTPATTLMAREVVDTQRGFGSVFYYGEHFKTQDVGQATAKLRAERHACERRTYRGNTDCARFRVGHTFELENHYEAAHDDTYLITAIEHRVGFPLLNMSGDLGTEPQRYLAQFEAIPKSVEFRPARQTAWPRIDGVINGHVDSDTDGKYADIDAEGRYKVKLPFNVAGQKGGNASRWIRMAQPYSGAGYGIHHPLHKGTEVLIAHIDGNPDRPIIVGSVPNPLTLTTSTTTNETQSVTQTASGIRIEMEDLQS